MATAVGRARHTLSILLERKLSFLVVVLILPTTSIFTTLFSISLTLRSLHGNVAYFSLVLGHIDV